MSDIETTQLLAPTWLELESIVPLEGKAKAQTVERITSLTPDTVQREYGDYVVRVSRRRRGMKLKDVLAITQGKLKRSA